MKLLPAFQDHYERHRASIDGILAGLTDPQLRFQPVEPGRSSSMTRPLAPAAWHLWCLARGEDAGFAQLADRQEVIAGPGWLEQLDVHPAELTPRPREAPNLDLAARIKLPTLRHYWQAVKISTLEILPLLPDELFDELVGGAYAPLKAADGTTSAPIGWVSHYRSGRTAHYRLPTPAHTLLRATKDSLTGLNRASR